MGSFAGKKTLSGVRARENKIQLSKIAGIKTRGIIVRSRARWYEHGERNGNFFYNLEKRNQKKATYNVLS